MDGQTKTLDLPQFRDELHEVPLHEISVNPFQPRRHFSEEELLELATSIREVGLIHPPIVRPNPHGEGYELVSGERRFRAAHLVGMTTIPVIVRVQTEKQSAHAALIENIQRVDLNPLEIAGALRRLAELEKLGQEELAQRVGKKRSTVANYLRLLNLPTAIQSGLQQDLITMGHAKTILSLENPGQQTFLYQKIIREQLTVRETEIAAVQLTTKKTLSATHVPPPKRNLFLEELMEKMQQRFGTKVTIRGRGKQGRIAIHYYNLDDLERLLRAFGLSDSIN